MVWRYNGGELLQALFCNRVMKELGTYSIFIPQSWTGPMYRAFDSQPISHGERYPSSLSGWWWWRYWSQWHCGNCLMSRKGFWTYLGRKYLPLITMTDTWDSISSGSLRWCRGWACCSYWEDFRWKTLLSSGSMSPSWWCRNYDDSEFYILTFFWSR